MSSSLLAVALPPSGDEPVPVMQAPHPLVFVVVPVIAAFGLLPALASPDPVYRLIMLALLGLFVVFALGSVMLSRSAAEGRVRIHDTAGALRFQPPAGMWILFAATAAAMVAIAIPAVLTGALGWSLPRASPFALGLVGVGFLVQQAWWLRTPAGLALGPGGIRGVRGVETIDVPWGELDDVRVIDARGAKLVLRTSGGIARPIGALWLGSDPTVIAAIIEFYRAHPEHRGALAGSPREALRIAEEALREQP